jgi:hypothetical protein
MTPFPSHVLPCAHLLVGLCTASTPVDIYVTAAYPFTHLFTFSYISSSHVCAPVTSFQNLSKLQDEVLLEFHVH